ncbi:MAG: hypothetical protein CMJ80_18135 [Planctomycetaceae bacterium]|nr:hypothetical protein [Planctomycetaceae bacterium]
MEAIDNYYARAKNHLTNGMALQALDILDNHLTGNPSDPQALELHGIVLHTLQQFPEARRSIETANLIGELSDAATLALADCYWFTGEQEIAQNLFLALAKRDQLAPNLRPGLAMGLGRMQAYHLAIEVCRQSALEDSTNYEARYGTAFYMSKAGYPPEIILPIVDRLVALQPREFHYRMTMATLHCRLDQLQNAYLAVADASLKELNTISCQCCIQRLITIYTSAGDQHRRQWCENRRQSI